MDSIRQRIESLINMVNEANALAGIEKYSFHFDDRQLMNVKADNSTFPIAFFEEYNSGYYDTPNYINKVTNVELYFCRLCQTANEGLEREQIREQIEEEAVKPFIRACLEHPEIIERVATFNFTAPPPRFDANEVSIMLSFSASYPSC